MLMLVINKCHAIQYAIASKKIIYLNLIALTERIT